MEEEEGKRMKHKQPDEEMAIFQNKKKFRYFER